MFLNKMRVHENNPVDGPEWWRVMEGSIFQPGQENHRQTEVARGGVSVVAFELVVGIGIMRPKVSKLSNLFSFPQITNFHCYFSHGRHNVIYIYYFSSRKSPTVENM